MEPSREKGQSGISLIEVIIVMAVIAVMVRMGMPSYGAWIGNQQIRAAAESITGAVNKARLEALKRNGRVMFQLTDAAAMGSAWRICPVAQGAIVCDPAQAVIEARDGGEESGAVTVGVSADLGTVAAGAMAAPLAAGGIPGGVIFEGRGRPVIAAGFNNAVRIDVRNTRLPAADERRLVIVIGAGGGVRSCDPRAVAPDPRTCG